MPEDLESFLKKEFIDMLFEEGPSFSYIVYNIESSNQAYGNSRRLSSVSYEAVVENKNGKKVKYTDSSSQIEVIAKGTEESNSNMLNFNILLCLLSLILLNF